VAVEAVECGVDQWEGGDSEAESGGSVGVALEAFVLEDSAGAEWLTYPMLD
jgi:hypothetical protein